jgi:hypothetical protein
LLVGFGALAASTAITSKASAFPQCECECRSPGPVGVEGGNCSGCKSSCERCPPSPCAVSGRFVYDVYCCNIDGRVCGREYETFFVKCC